MGAGKIAGKPANGVYPGTRGVEHPAAADGDFQVPNPVDCARARDHAVTELKGLSLDVIGHAGALTGSGPHDLNTEAGIVHLRIEILGAGIKIAPLQSWKLVL